MLGGIKYCAIVSDELAVSELLRYFSFLHLLQKALVLDKRIAKYLVVLVANMFLLRSLDGLCLRFSLFYAEKNVWHSLQLCMYIFEIMHMQERLFLILFMILIFFIILTDLNLFYYLGESRGTQLEL